MKQLVLILCMVFFVSSYVCGQGYVITGELSGADGQTVSLKQFRNQQPVEVNKTTVQAGKFKLTGVTPYPEFCMLYVGEQGPVQFFIENSNIRISADPENPQKPKVTGSNETDIYMEFVKSWENFEQQQKRLSESYMALSMSNATTQESAMNVRAQMEKLNMERNAFVTNFLQKHSGKVVTAYLLNQGLMQMLNVAQMEQVVHGFDAKNSQSPWVKTIKDRAATLKRTDVGQPFLDVTLKTPDDQPISISDYAGKGKYVLLDFWASWCGPCRNENPNVLQLYNRYKNKGFEIVGISLDTGKEAWVKAISDDKLTWPQMSDLKYWESVAAKQYSVSSIPHTILLDKDGKILAKGLRGETLAAKLAELMD